VIWPGEPEALEAGQDDPRVHRGEPVVVEAEPLHEPGGEVLGHHVRPLDQPQEEGVALRLLEVDGDAALVGVEEQEEHRVEAGHLRPVAPRLLAAGRLDLDDVGAEPAQELGAGGARLELGEIQDPDAGQRVIGHDPSRP